MHLKSMDVLALRYTNWSTDKGVVVSGFGKTPIAKQLFLEDIHDLTAGARKGLIRLCLDSEVMPCTVQMQWTLQYWCGSQTGVTDRTERAGMTDVDV